jgi:hypothetical protein
MNNTRRGLLATAVVVLGLLAYLGMQRTPSRPGDSTSTDSSPTIREMDPAAKHDIVDSWSAGGTTVVKMHDRDSGAVVGEVRTDTKPLTAEEVDLLVDMFEKANRSAAAVNDKLRGTAMDGAQQIRFAHNDRSTALRNAALTEARAGHGFEVLSGPLPRHDKDYYMYSLPRPKKPVPGREHAMWCIPLPRASHPDLATHEAAVTAAERGVNDAYCHQWNALPLERRQQIVAAAEAAQTESQLLLSMIRDAGRVGMNGTPELAQARGKSSQLDRVVAARPMGLSPTLEAIVGKTRFRVPPPQR